MERGKDRGWRSWSRYLLVSLLLNLLILVWVTQIEVTEGEPLPNRREPTTLFFIDTGRDTEPQRLATIRRLIEEITEPIIVNSEDLEPEDAEDERIAEKSPTPSAVEDFDVRYDYRIPAIIVQPVLIGGRHDPVMPDSLANSKWEGTVTLGLLIDDQGGLIDIWVEDSSGREDADRDAVACYRDTKWTPATVDGRPTVCRLFVKVPYQQAYLRARF